MCFGVNMQIKWTLMQYIFLLKAQSDVLPRFTLPPEKSFLDWIRSRLRAAASLLTVISAAWHDPLVWLCSSDAQTQQHPDLQLDWSPEPELIKFSALSPPDDRNDKQKRSMK